MIYRAAKGARFSDESAQRYGDRIEVIQEKLGDEVTPQDVLSDAKRMSSPLHSFFEWDDVRAAEKHRLMQAHYLLRSIHIVVKQGGVEETTRAFHHVVIRESENEVKCSGRSVYVSLKRVLSEEELHGQVLDEALRQLRSWQSRYRQYQEFATVLVAIAAVEEEMAL